MPEKAQDKAQEPSMEEILASIRRIIADDQKTAEEPEPVRPAPPPEDDVLDLAEVAQPLRRPVPQAASTVVPFDVPEIGFRDEEIDFDAIEVEPDPPPPPPRPATRPPEPVPERIQDRIEAGVEEAAAERLLSQATDSSVNQAFNLLAHTVLTNNARTLEDLVREMLRPMLKAWLDDNLSTLVERLVRAEIERVARGR